MQIRKIDEDYSVSPQIEAADMAAIKEAGFKSVICNRPDDEDAGQPPVDTIREAAEKAGLAFRFIPVISGRIVEENVTDQAAALDELPQPVLAYCRSGTRCTNLYGLIKQSR